MEISALAGMATNLQAESLQQKVGTRVLKMQMDSTETAGQAMIEMIKASTLEMERAVTPHLGKNLDVIA